MSLGIKRRNKALKNWGLRVLVLSIFVFFHRINPDWPVIGCHRGHIAPPLYKPQFIHSSLKMLIWCRSSRGLSGCCCHSSHQSGCSAMWGNEWKLELRRALRSHSRPFSQGVALSAHPSCCDVFTSSPWLVPKCLFGFSSLLRADDLNWGGLEDHSVF